MQAHIQAGLVLQRRPALVEDLRDTRANGAEAEQSYAKDFFGCAVVQRCASIRELASACQERLSYINFRPEAIRSREQSEYMSVLQRIRQRIIDREYELSDHAEDELIEDDLDRFDVEHAILNGIIEKKMTGDPRGTRYRIEGPSRDGRFMHVICRFDPVRELLVITVYALENG